jgi:hypothetical protein
MKFYAVKNIYLFLLVLTLNEPDKHSTGSGILWPMAATMGFLPLYYAVLQSSDGYLDF